MRMPEHNENGRIMLFYAVRLRDLVRPRAALRVTCGFCKRTSELDVVDLGYARGPYTTLRTLEPAFRCGQCGAGGWVPFGLRCIE